MKSNKTSASYSPTKVVIGAFLVLTSCLLCPARAYQIIDIVPDCNTDATICASDEVCFEGFCLALSQQLIQEPDLNQSFRREIKALEELFSDYEADTTDAPIRVHKYEVDPVDYSSEQTFDDYGSGEEEEEEEEPNKEEIIEIKLDDRDLDEFFKNYEIKRPILNLKRDESVVDEPENADQILNEIEKDLILNELVENNLEILAPVVDDDDEDEADESERVEVVDDSGELESAVEEQLKDIIVDEMVEDELRRTGLLEDEQDEALIDDLTGRILEANPQLVGHVQSAQPIVYENSGLDRDGNPYYEKQVIQSFHNEIPISPYNVNSIAEQMRQRQELLAGAQAFQDTFVRQQMAMQQQQHEQEMQMRMGSFLNPMGGLLGSIMGQLMQQEQAEQHPFPGLRFHLVEQPANAEQEHIEIIKNLAMQQQQQQQQEQEQKDINQDDQFRTGLNNFFDKVFDAENQILGSPESEEQKEALDQQEINQQQSHQEMHRNFLKEQEEEQRIQEKRVRNFEFLTPESAINFELNVKPHQVPKKGQFHLRQAKYEHKANDHELDDKERQMRTEQAREIEHEKFDFVMAPLAGENGVELLEKESMPKKVVSEMETMENNNEDLKGDENSVKEVELEKTVDATEKAYLERVRGEAQGLKFLQLEDLTNSIYLRLSDKITDSDADRLLNSISIVASLPAGSVKDVRSRDNLLKFDIDFAHAQSICKVVETFHQAVFEENGLKLVSCSVESSQKFHSYDSNKVLFIVTLIVCVSVLCVLIGLIAVFFVKRRDYLRQKLIENVSNLKPNKGKFDDIERLVTDQSTGNRLKNKVWPFKTKQVSTQQADLCRSANLSPLSDTQSTVLTNRTENFESTPVTVDERKVSTRSSASSWSDEPVSNANIDITTGHAILAYMEEHLNDKSRLDIEWVDLCGYEADRNDVFSAKAEENMTKNRYSNILPYDHNRVKLYSVKEGETDYINASYVTDDDPKNPAYIATQGPLLQTTSDFWKMVWEQNSVIIVSLCRTVEYGSSKCNQYWPVNGFERYGEYEVHLVSEHVWCEDYLVRSFYLMNKALNQTRTVTQFQFLSWPETSMPPSIKSILDFRRKVNKSYNKKSFPIIVHCNDGIGRTGTYIMIDMVLNKIAKEAKEIDLAATVEYLRDQRKDMIKNKNQFEFSFAVVTEEVQNMLKTVIQ